MSWRIVLCLASLVAGCVPGAFRPVRPEPLPPESAELPPVGVRVEGVVMNRWGYAVADASVTVRVGAPTDDLAGDPECSGASHVPTRTRTTPMGQFAVAVEAGRRPPFLACLEVEAIPARGLGYHENRVIVPSAAFTTAGAAGGGEVVQVRVFVY